MRYMKLAVVVFVLCATLVLAGAIRKGAAQNVMGNLLYAPEPSKTKKAIQRRSDEFVTQGLTRQRQIDLMVECIADADMACTQAGEDKRRVFRRGVFQMKASVAAAFFEYRTR